MHTVDIVGSDGQAVRQRGRCAKPTQGPDQGILLTEKSQILKLWTEHFKSALNRPSKIPDVVIAQLTQGETDNNLDLPPFLPETTRVGQQISNGKALGSDAIPAEVKKHDDPRLMDKLTRILVRIILNRPPEQRLLTESRCGFRRHRRTTDMILAARQMQEKYQQMRTHLYATLVDLIEAFDRSNSDGLWKIIKKFGCSGRLMHLVSQLHNGMMAPVTDNGTVSDECRTTNGMKQRFILAPTLFSLLFSAMLMDVYYNERPGTCIVYRADGHPLNSWRVQAPARHSKTTVHDLLFADDSSQIAIAKAKRAAHRTSLDPSQQQPGNCTHYLRKRLHRLPCTSSTTPAATATGDHASDVPTPQQTPTVPTITAITPVRTSTTLPIPKTDVNTSDALSTTTVLSPAALARSQPVPIAITPSYAVSICSVPCEFVTLRPATQCPEPRHTSIASD
ncbi:hypothetical protein SprV_0100270000 [Sparganum proliferum]